MENISFFTEHKDLLTICSSFTIGLVGLLTLIKAILEFRLQGRQKRAELFDKFKSNIKTEQRIVHINSLIEDDDHSLRHIDYIDKYYYLGYYEQIAIAVNSGLIKRDVAHYMFGYYVLRCWESENFWGNINRDSPYWGVYKSFYFKMKKLEKRNFEKNIFIKFWDIITGRKKFKY